MMPRINSLACQLAQLNTDSVRRSESTRRITRQSNHFPIGLSTFVKILPGNDTCIDCRFRQEEEPSDELLWANITFGTIICAMCAHEHITSGNTSDILSLETSSWDKQQILSLLEGGNEKVTKALSKDFKRARKTPSIKDRYNTKSAKQYSQNHLSRVGNLYKSFEEKIKEQASKSAFESNHDDRSSRKQDPISKTHGVDDSQPRAARAGTMSLGIPFAGKVLESITSGIKQTIGIGGQQLMNPNKDLQQKSPMKPISRHEVKNTGSSTIQRTQPKPVVETRVDSNDVEKSANLFMSRMKELGLNADTCNNTGSGSDGANSKRGRRINDKQRQRRRAAAQISRQSFSLQPKMNELHIEPLGVQRRNVQIREDQNVDMHMHNNSNRSLQREDSDRDKFLERIRRSSSNRPDDQNVDMHMHNNSNRSLQREDSDRDKFLERIRRSSSNRPDVRQRGVTMVSQSSPRREFLSTSLIPPSSTRYLQSSSNSQSGKTKRMSTLNKRSSMDTSLAIVVDEPRLGADSQVPNAVIPELVRQNFDSREYHADGESFGNNNNPHSHHTHNTNRNRPRQPATQQYPQNIDPVRRPGISLEPGQNETLIRSRNHNISQSNRYPQRVVPHEEIPRSRSSVELAQDPRSSNNRFQINIGTRVAPHQDSMNKFTTSSVNGFSNRNKNVFSSNRVEPAYEQRNLENISLFNTTLRRNVNSQLQFQRTSN